ncbi:hypothetical protein FRC10_001432 [Ceratobasidium sp. 414]|nr:hypothetical protein FRC10_001432 [Ceratobasidium sp. 414]
MPIQPACDAGTFAGVGMELDRSEPIVRHKPGPVGSSYESNRKRARENLGKVWNDMQRQVILQVKRAIARKVVLPFRVADFVRLRQQHKVPVHTGGCVEELAGHPTRLKAEDGPAVVVDLSETVVMWYFPGFIGEGLMPAVCFSGTVFPSAEPLRQAELLRTLSDLAKVYRPMSDAEIRDRRARSNAAKTNRAERGDQKPTVPGRVLTRQQAARLATANAAHEVEQGAPASEREGGTEDEQESDTEDELGDTGDPSEGGWSSMPTEEFESGAAPTCPEPYVETDGDIRWRGSGDGDAEAQRASPEKSGTAALTAVGEYLSKLPPFAYYISPGWYQTGMENIRPMAMSSHFRDALRDECSAEAIAMLRAQRLYHRKLAYLTSIIHSSLNESLQVLREHMLTVTGPTSVALENGWTSAFPCVGMAVNRTCRLHRDTKGIRGGMDVIGVLGTFVRGGELVLPDVYLEVEWTPGCVGAFDGYDFRHEVKPWEGGTRVALVSFCRKSTWKGLKLDCTIARATLPDANARLKFAQDVRAAAVLKACESQTQQQVAEREDRERKKALAKAEQAKQLATQRLERQARKLQHRANWDESGIGHRQRGMEYGDQEQELRVKRPKLQGGSLPVSRGR